MRRLLAVVALVLAGCQSPCNSTTCFGCCLDGVCMGGREADACGTKGNVCAVCGAGEYCVAAACLAIDIDAGVEDAGAPCECAGSCCLADGGCAASNDAKACGANRTWCAACDVGFRCEAGACVSQSCAGCFDPLGNCHPGTADTACGSGGGWCQTCGDDQDCTANVCRFTHCGATNCTFGCCLPDNTCVTSTSDTACGTNGAACVACGAGSQCLNGSCL